MSSTEDLSRQEKRTLKEIQDFFAPNVWKDMSDYEKKSLCSTKRNYDAMLAAGLEPRKPVFMMSYQEKKDYETGKPKRIRLEGKKHKPKPTKQAVPRGPVRRSRRMQIDGIENVQDADDILLCDECGLQWAGDCPRHGPLLIVQNTEVPAKGGDRVRGSLPPALVAKPGAVCFEDDDEDEDVDVDGGLGDDSDANAVSGGQDGDAEAGEVDKQALLGVWTREAVPMRTRFGPYEGDVPDDPDGGRGGTGANANWMQLVQQVRKELGANLRPYEFGGRLYFRTTQSIAANSELFVYFGRSSSSFLVGVTCKLCNAKYSDPLLLAQHERASPKCAARILKQRLAVAAAAKQRSYRDWDDGGGKERQEMLREQRELLREKREMLREQRELQRDQAWRQQEAICRRGVERLRQQHASTFGGLRDVSAAANILDDADLKCSLCGEQFRRSCRLRAHMDSHVDDALTAEARAWDCSACKASFSSSDELREHVILTHIGLKRYPCKDCGASFNRNSALENHAQSCHH